MSINTLPPAAIGIAAAAVVQSRWIRGRSKLERHVDAVKARREIDDWGFKLFSQNDEDGIINVLVEQLQL